MDGRVYSYRKLKGEILVNPAGVIRIEDHVNIATPERAFLDLLYLRTEFYFDNLSPINRRMVKKLLPLYQSKAMAERVTGILSLV